MRVGMVFLIFVFVLSTFYPAFCDNLVVSAYEYPIKKALRDSCLQHLRVIPKHNNKTIKPNSGMTNIATFPYGEKLLLVATIDSEFMAKASVKGIKWSFMRKGKMSYGGYPAVEVSIVKGAGVPENQIAVSADQITTKLGVTPVYPPLPHTVIGLKEGSGEPVDKIDIKPNQSWVIIRSFEPGISKVLVSVVTEDNTVSPEVEYAVHWVGKYPNICQKQVLEVNVVEAPSSSDPFVFTTAIDQYINYVITVKDVSPYYQNPTAPSILPLLYPDIPYTLRFRIDPLQQVQPWDKILLPSGDYEIKPWADAYWVSWGECNDEIRDSLYELRLDAKYSGSKLERRVVYKNLVITPTKNGGEPPAQQTFNAYVVFRGYNPDPHFYYFKARERSVDASVAYSGSSCSKTKSYKNINDESTTIEYQPNENLGGLEVKWDPAGSPYGMNAPVKLTNTGGRIYEIFGETPSGMRWSIAPYLDAGTSIYIQANKGDWIYYHTISNNNTDKCREPVIAKQRKVRVQ